MLGTGLSFRTTRWLRWRFWRCYHGLRTDLQGLALRDGAEIIERRSRRSMLALFRRRVKRFFRENRDFQLLNRHGGRAHAVASVPRESVAALLDGNLSALIPDGRPGVDAATSGVHLRSAEQRQAAWWECGETRLPVTVVRQATPSRQLRWLPRRFAAGLRQQWFAGHSVLLRRIATPRPLAIVRSRRAQGATGELLIVERRPDCQPLDAFLAELANRDAACRAG